MASGHTTGIVLVRFLVVWVTRHLSDASLDTPSRMVLEAFNTSAVPLNSSAMDAISSLFMRDTPGLPVSGSVTHWSAFPSTPSAITGMLPPCSLPMATVKASDRYRRNDENVRRAFDEVCSPSENRYSTIASSGC